MLERRPTCDRKKPIGVTKSSPRRNRFLEGLGNLPNELLLSVLTRAIHQQDCAFHLFVPDWRLCEGIHTSKPPQSPDPFDTFINEPRFRFDTYKTGDNGDITNAFTTFDHDPTKEHFHVGIQEDLGSKLGFSKAWDRNLIRGWADESLITFSQKFTHAGVYDATLGEHLQTESLLRGPRMARLLPGKSDAEGESKNSIPSLDEKSPEVPLYKRFRHGMLNTDPALWDVSAEDFVTFASGGDITTISDEERAWLRPLRQRLAAERDAHLTVDFECLGRLESLWLDVRAGGSGDAALVTAAKSLAARTKGNASGGLTLLVLAGLRPGFETARTGVASAGKDDNELGVLASEKKWAWDLVGMFLQALRPGGALVLVDKERWLTED